MPRPEDEPRSRQPRRRFTRRRGERGSGLVLPETLKEVLREPEYACLMDATSVGTAFIVKAPAAEIDSARGTVPILLRHELYDHVRRVGAYLYPFRRKEGLSARPLGRRA